MRHAYITPGVTDPDALRRYAQQRDDKTLIHDHEFFGFGVGCLCKEVVEGRNDRAR